MGAIASYKDATLAIKTAILQSRYGAGGSGNAIQLHPAGFVASTNEPEPANGPEPANVSAKDGLLSLLRMDPRISYERAAKRLGVSRSSIRRYLRALEADGLIQRVSADKNGHWKVLRG